MDAHIVWFNPKSRSKSIMMLNSCRLGIILYDVMALQARGQVSVDNAHITCVMTLYRIIFGR